MAITTGTASALTGGSSRKHPPPRMVEVEIVRGVFIAGVARAPGDRVELPDYEANHMIGIGKAKKSTPVPMIAQEEPPAEEPVNKPKRMGRPRSRGDDYGSD